MNVNEINDAWVASGQKVSDLNAKINTAVLDDENYDEAAVKDLKGQRDKEVSRRNDLKDALEQARKDAKVIKPKQEVKDVVSDVKPKKDIVEIKKDFVNNFRGLIRNDPRVLNMLTSSTDDPATVAGALGSGLVIPQDIETAINTLVRQYASLQQYVKVESVGTQTGSRVYEKWTDVTPLADLDDETATIGDNDDPRLTKVSYAIHRYAGINTVTNSLLKDTDENILAWLESWIARKVVVTRNQKILSAVSALPGKPSIAKFDDVINLADTSVDPAIINTSVFMTNVSGCAKLHRVKDAFGNYLIQPNNQAGMGMTMLGHPIVMISDRWLPSAGTASAPQYPLYYGDLSQAVTLFDRENMELLSTNIGAGSFEKDQTKIRVIDRFDVEPTDTETFVAGSFTAIADQQANFAASSSSSAS